MGHGKPDGEMWSKWHGCLTPICPFRSQNTDVHCAEDLCALWVDEIGCSYKAQAQEIGALRKLVERKLNKLM